MMDLTGKGALIERGKIFAREGTRYKVVSLDRPEVVSRWMRASSFFVNEREDEEGSVIRYSYAVGDPVFFFMFPDGRGLILGRIEAEVTA